MKKPFFVAFSLFLTTSFICRGQASPLNSNKGAVHVPAKSLGLLPSATTPWPLQKTQRAMGECGDVSYSQSSGEYSVYHKNKLFIFVSNSTNGLSLQKTIEIPASKIINGNSTIYRDGKIWSFGDDGIYLLSEGKWTLRMPVSEDMKVKYRNIVFDVYEDKVLFFGCPHAFVEEFNINSGVPGKKVPYPTNLGVENTKWQPFVIAKREHDIIAYSTTNGELYLFNEQNNKASALAVPWEPKNNRSQMPINAQDVLTFPRACDVFIIPGPNDDFVVIFGMDSELKVNDAVKVEKSKRADNRHPIHGLFYSLRVHASSGAVHSVKEINPTTVLLWPNKHGKLHSMTEMLAGE